MGVSPEGDKVSMRDVLAIATEIEESFPWQVRIVITFRGHTGTEVSHYVRAQACNADGSPDERVAWQGSSWPCVGSRTYAGMLFELLWRLYTACELRYEAETAKPRVS